MNDRSLGYWFQLDADVQKDAKAAELLEPYGWTPASAPVIPESEWMKLPEPPVELDRRRPVGAAARRDALAGRVRRRGSPWSALDIGDGGSATVAALANGKPTVVNLWATCDSASTGISRRHGGHQGFAHDPLLRRAGAPRGSAHGTAFEGFARGEALGSDEAPADPAGLRACCVRDRTEPRALCSENGVSQPQDAPMSIFSKVLQEVEQKRKSAEEAARALAVEQAGADAAFLAEFRAVARAVAKPMFEEFVTDATSNGFTANVTDDTGDASQPVLSVAFAPVKGTRAYTPASEICTYSIRALAIEKMVLHTVYYDQRPQKDGVHQEKLGIESITAEVLERHLADLTRSALQAREDGARK